MDKIKRERTGSFFTPQIWVELSQKYLTDVLGVNWQDEYYIWDCAAGTGNLLAGLTNKKNIWASTLDKQDVDVIHDRIENGANLWKNNVFQFDFLNDDFTKLPKNLQDIINNPEKRKKLVVYINPPYAEATASSTITGSNRHKSGLSQNITYSKYISIFGRSINEIFIQFFAKIYYEIPDCIIAEFSKLKILQSQNFYHFRENFKAKLEKLFLVPADTFDNVKGQFSIGFFIWNTNIKEKFIEIQADVFNSNAKYSGKKKITNVEKNKVILNWMQKYYDKSNERLAYMVRGASDFQNSKIVFITNGASVAVIEHSQTHNITKNNLTECSIFFAVRHVLEATWLNDRDQFLYPKDTWKKDIEFQNNCLTFTLFSNNIQSKFGTNHWIPFTEDEVNAKEEFESDFMAKYIAGKLKNDTENKPLIKTEKVIRNTPLVFSKEAKDVFEAGKNLWTYYHKQPKCNANASLYDIRSHFQGRNESGKMNHKSADSAYMQYINILREKLKVLAKKIEPKVYEHGFLLE